jgi:hypothetical protein
MRLGALQSHRQVQMLAKMFDDAIDLLVGHCSQPLLTRCLPGQVSGSEFLSARLRIYTMISIGSSGWIRTSDHSINSRMLYR